MNVAILGGTSGFGLWLAKFIKNKFPNTNIIITGRNKEKGEIISKENNFNFTTNNEKAVEGSDIVIFSVPISKMEETIKLVGPFIKRGSIVLDVCSIKGFPSIAMKKYCKNAKLIIPTHPMFGPYVQDIAGQIIVLTPEDNLKKDIKYLTLKHFLNKEGAKIIETSPKKHDKMMAVVQGLTHINMFTIGETIRRLNVSVKESLDFVSPIYKIMISSVARYVGHDAKLYADIQMYNPEVINVHKKFMEVIKDFSDIVVNKDKEKFIGTIENTKKHFGDETTSFGQKYTDKIIYLMSLQIEKILENIGNELTFRNIYSGKEIKGKVISYKNEKVFLENEVKLNLNEWFVL